MIGVIPARKGSKGLPGKNMADLGSIPLIEWTLRAAVESEVFETIVVSSDCPDVERVARKFCVNFIERSKRLCQDTTPMTEVVLDVLRRGVASDCEAFALLQPTSPLRSASHIRACKALFKNNGERSCVSVSRLENSLLKSFIVHDGTLHPLESGKYFQQRRQDLPDVVKPNGAIYMQNTTLFQVKKSFIPPGSSFYLMENPVSVDIDTEDDLILARTYVHELGQND